MKLREVKNIATMQGICEINMTLCVGKICFPVTLYGIEFRGLGSINMNKISRDCSGFL